MQLSLSVLQALLVGAAWAAPIHGTSQGRFLGPRRAPLYPGTELAFSNDTAGMEKRRLPEYPGIKLNETNTAALEKRRLPEYPGIKFNETDNAAGPQAGDSESLVKRRTAVYPGTEYQPKKKPEPKPEWDPEWDPEWKPEPKPECDPEWDPEWKPKPKPEWNPDWNPEWNPKDEHDQDEGTDCSYDSDVLKTEYIPQLPKEYQEYTREEEKVW